MEKERKHGSYKLKENNPLDSMPSSTRQRLSLATDVLFYLTIASTVELLF